MKLHWPRTMQLFPVHLHQRDAYVEDLLARRATRWVSDAYGVLELALDDAAADTGEIVIRRLEAILPSGLVVRVDAETALRRSVETAPADGGARDVYVGVPLAVLRGPNVSAQGGPARSTRYAAVPGQGGAWLRAKAEILFEGESLEGFEVLRVGRARRLGKGVRFEREALPTILRIRAARGLTDGLRSLIGAIERRRGELVRHRADHPLNLDAVVASELPALELFVILQRALPLLADAAAARSFHPRELYAILIALHGALRVFAATPEIAPAYAHDDPTHVFAWLFARIEDIVDRAARDHTTILPFRRVDTATFQLSFEHGDLVGKRPLLVLSGGDETFLRERVPALLKMASPTAIAPILNSAVQGVAVAVEFEPPASVPKKQGTVAYRVDVRDALWLDVVDRMQVQLNLVGAAPALQAYLYAVERIG